MTKSKENETSLSSVIVTGGAGFIGSAVVRGLIRNRVKNIIVVDSLTYAGNLKTLSNEKEYPGFIFENIDIRDAVKTKEVIDKHSPDAVMHLAAESHVDRSIDGPGLFMETNITGTYNLLEAIRSLNVKGKKTRFHHVSTDEVFGSLGSVGKFTEESPYKPNSPYSASKASSDHLVRSWGETFGLDIVISNCSNNYGPYQYPEKLIPLVIHRVLSKNPIPVYGKGDNVRDWLYVDDHADALIIVMEKGISGETYNIGGDSEMSNLDVIKTICSILDTKRKDSDIESYTKLIEFVSDRPGHDFRYAIDSTKIKEQLDWKPNHNFISGLNKTVDWYLNNQEWVLAVEGLAASQERKGLGEGK